MLDYLITPTTLVRREHVTSIDFTRIEEAVIVLYYNGVKEEVSGVQALNLLMQIRPSALEGKRLKWAKNAWVVHNLVGHPLMQILALLKCYNAAMWIHEVTIPRPVGPRTST